MYADISQLRGRLKNSFDGIYDAVVAGSVTTFPDAQADLEAANGQVDGYLAGRYLAPVTADAVLPLLQHYTLTLASELAYMRSAGSEMPKKIADAVKQVRADLQAIADGNKRLPGVPETAVGQGGASILSIEKPVFDQKSMEGF